MRELIYTLLELERESRKACDFCSNFYGKDNESAFRIVTRIKSNKALKVFLSSGGRNS